MQKLAHCTPGTLMTPHCSFSLLAMIILNILKKSSLLVTGHGASVQIQSMKYSSYNYPPSLQPPTDQQMTHLGLKLGQSQISVYN